MAVRDALLGLLSQGPRHGYQLKSGFDAATGSAWPLNIGQVYSTLQRLEKSDLVEPAGPPDDGGRVTYQLTGSGRKELNDWLSGPVAQPLAVRDELSLKVLIALVTGAAPVDEVIQAQRTGAMSTLQLLTRMKAELAPVETLADEELAWALHVDRMVFIVNAELRWLDLTEDRLDQRANKRSQKDDQAAGLNDDNSDLKPQDVQA